MNFASKGLMTQRFEQFRIPVPNTTKPLDPIDPTVNPEACIQMVSILYHAEKAALDAFERLNDPSIVENCEIFLTARPMLVADESAHLRDMEEIIHVFGGNGVRPPLPGFDEFWSIDGASKVLLFPLRARVAALFTLVTESLGYAYLYHLANVMTTTNPKVGQLLTTNIRDEEKHIRVSMHVLCAALTDRKGLAGFDLVLHFFAFLLLSRRAAKTMLSILKQVGFDPYVLASSSLQFTCLLLLQVANGRKGICRQRRHLERMLRFILSPLAMRIYNACCYLPVMPGTWPAFRSLSRIVERFSVRALAKQTGAS
jgi:hypothetical protein